MSKIENSLLTAKTERDAHNKKLLDLNVKTVNLKTDYDALEKKVDLTKTHAIGAETELKKVQAKNKIGIDKPEVLVI